MLCCVLCCVFCCVCAWGVKCGMCAVLCAEQEGRCHRDPGTWLLLARLPPLAHLTPPMHGCSGPRRPQSAPPYLGAPRCSDHNSTNKHYAIRTDQSAYHVFPHAAAVARADSPPDGSAVHVSPHAATHAPADCTADPRVRRPPRVPRHQQDVLHRQSHLRRLWLLHQRRRRGGRCGDLDVVFGPFHLSPARCSLLGAHTHR